MQSTREVVCGIAATVALAAAACDRKPSAPPPPPPATDQAHDHDHDHDHAPGEGHGGHSHATADTHDLGTATIGGVQVQALRYGTLTPGKESDVDIRFPGATALPAAVRVWIGTEDARGSIKSRAEAESDHFHAHVETPDPLPQDARLWIEVESAGGERSVGSFPLAMPG